MNPLPSTPSTRTSPPVDTNPAAARERLARKYGTTTAPNPLHPAGQGRVTAAGGFALAAERITTADQETDHHA